MFTLHLAAADSRLATEAEVRAAGILPGQLPPNWCVRLHQLRTIEALRDPNASIIVNDAMTGDGKSLGGQWMLLNERWRTFTMYPTNELARDQQRSLDELSARWTPPAWQGRDLLREVLTAETLDDMDVAGNYDVLSRPDRVEFKLDSRDLVLTNPDIFHWIMQFNYQQYGNARDVVASRLVQRYRLFVFDEFHTYGTAQTASVVMAVLLLRAMTRGSTRPPKFLFLSATPASILTTLINQAARLEPDLRIAPVHGEYVHGEATTPDGYERILRPVRLTLSAGRLEDWVREHVDDVLVPFFAQHRPGARGVVIANSIATAHRLHKWLTEKLRPHSISVGVNTGAMPRAARDLDNVDLLVATSTVDVGVDFRVNLLVFESSDAATHLQRLGRLGRHDDDGKGHAFEHFEAHTVVPQWVYDTLTSRLHDGKHMSRDDYRVELNDAFPPPQSFIKYNTRWAGVQAAHVLRQMQHFSIRTQYAELREQLYQVYKEVFRDRQSYYRQLTKRGEEKKAILDSVKSFRGGSTFTALVAGVTDRSPEWKPYNLVTLLLRGDLEEVEVTTALREAERQGQPRAALERGEPLAAYRVRDWLEMPRRVSVRLHWEEEPGEKDFNCVNEMNGFSFDAPGVPEINALKGRMRERTFAFYLIPNKDPDLVRRVLRLGLQLELFAYLTPEGQTGTVAFGRDALLLDAVWFQKQQSGGVIII